MIILSDRLLVHSGLIKLMGNNLSKWNRTRYFSIKLFLAFICCAALIGCDDDSEINKRCDPLPTVNGFKAIKLYEGGLPVKLPFYADIRRYPRKGCEFASDVFIDYIWYEGKLISRGVYHPLLNEISTVKVDLYFIGSGSIEDVRRSSRNDQNANKRPWRFDGALLHKRFPLQYYPKLYWDNPDVRSKNAFKREQQDSYWGIRNTKYKHVHKDRGFSAFCSIPSTDKSTPSTRIANDFSKFGGGGCRGYITAGKNGKYLSATIDVKVDFRNNQKGMMKINKIYDAAVEQLQSFIQE
ncbi:MAG: hypothetical protein KUG82_21370 [Pseudomonadales bacterium]|nr:hypothetical protein [Pseudomonadales bacterium]